MSTNGKQEPVILDLNDAQDPGQVDKPRASVPTLRVADATDYLNEFVGLGGTNIKFDGKVGKFVCTQDGTPLPDNFELTCLFLLTEGGWIRFNGKGNPPDTRMGQIFGGFMPPRREDLGDLDKTQWPAGLSGRAEDPWQHQIKVPFVDKDGASYIFSTTSITGRRAVGNLLSHCNRLAKKEPDLWPVVQLRVGGYNHRDDRIGWVATPVFAITGKAPRDGIEVGKLSTGDDLADEVPF
jgi:hypothetical protein